MRVRRIIGLLAALAGVVGTTWLAMPLSPRAPFRVLPGTVSWMGRAAFSPDGRRLVTLRFRITPGWKRNVSAILRGRGPQSGPSQASPISGGSPATGGISQPRSTASQSSGTPDAGSPGESVPSLRRTEVHSLYQEMGAG